MGGTFVTIGNSPRQFARLLDEVSRIAPQLPQPVVVQHGRTAFGDSRLLHFDFTDGSNFDTYVENCDLLITHAGGGSVLKAVRMGKTPVVVPRLSAFGEHVDDHQVALANEMAREDAIVQVGDIGELLASCNKALSRPMRSATEIPNARAIAAVSGAVRAFAPDPQDCIGLITPSGGHLDEIRALAQVYRDHPHFYAINVPIVEPPEMRGRTTVLTLSERDWKFLVNLWEAFRILRTHRPKVLLTTGGGFSVAFTLIGKLFGIPTIYIETIGKVVVPTATGRLMYRLADRFFYQWANLASRFPRGEYIGLVL